MPVRAFGRFYVTGWAGDPCSEKYLGKKAPKDPGSLAYTYDEEPEEEGVLVELFVKYVNDSPYATGAGECHERPSATVSPCSPSEENVWKL